MSLIRPLLRFIDPIQFHQDELERKRQRETVFPDGDPDELDATPPSAAPIVKQLVCRICEARGTGRYCLVCLAETMVEP